jgi:hypothetical protein
MCCCNGMRQGEPGFKPCPCCLTGELPATLYAGVRVNRRVAGLTDDGQVKAFFPIQRGTDENGRHFWAGFSAEFPGSLPRRRVGVRLRAVPLCFGDFPDVPEGLKHGGNKARWVHAFTLEEESPGASGVVTYMNLYEEGLATAQTAAPHGLAAGRLVRLSGTEDPAVNGQVVHVIDIPDASTFVFETGGLFDVNSLSGAFEDVTPGGRPWVELCGEEVPNESRFNYDDCSDVMWGVCVAGNILGPYEGEPYEVEVVRNGSLVPA